MTPISCSQCLETITPKASPFPLVRIGGCADGAYLLPDDLSGIESCFSPGVDNFKVFEDDLARRYQIKSHLCDFSSDPSLFSTPLIEGLQTFQKAWLRSASGPDSITLDEWVSSMSPSSACDLILQCDIEGGEYEVINSCRPSTIDRFRIIVIELHDLHQLLNPSHLQTQISLTLDRLSRNHICIHIHPNNCSELLLDPNTGLDVPNVAEVTFLRKDRFYGDPSSFFPARVPHPLDIECNLVVSPPIHLSPVWLQQGASVHALSARKISLDHLFYRYRQIRSHVVQSQRLLNSSDSLTFSGCASLLMRLYFFLFFKLFGLYLWRLKVRLESESSNRL